MELGFLEELGHGIARECHRAGAGKLASSALEEFEDAVLDDLGVHLECGDVGAGLQRVEHCVGDVTHTTLDGEELLGHAAMLHLTNEELADILANLGGDLIDRGERCGHAQRHRRLDDAHHLLGVDVCDGLAGAVTGFVDGDLAAQGRVERHVDVVHAVDALGEHVVDFDDDLLGALEPSGCVAHRGAEDHVTVVGDALHLNDGDVHLAVVAIAELLAELAQVTVVVVDITGIDVLAQVAQRLVGRTEVEGIDTRQLTVGVVVG